VGGVTSSGDDVERVESLEFDKFWDEFGLRYEEGEVQERVVVGGVGGV